MWVGPISREAAQTTQHQKRNVCATVRCVSILGGRQKTRFCAARESGRSRMLEDPANRSRSGEGRSGFDLWALQGRSRIVLRPLCSRSRVVPGQILGPGLGPMWVDLESIRGRSAEGAGLLSRAASGHRVGEPLATAISDPPPQTAPRPSLTRVPRRGPPPRLRMLGFRRGARLRHRLRPSGVTCGGGLCTARRRA